MMSLESKRRPDVAVHVQTRPGQVLVHVMYRQICRTILSEVHILGRTIVCYLE
jgi:hypothetical protein